MALSHENQADTNPSSMELDAMALLALRNSAPCPSKPVTTMQSGPNRNPPKRKKKGGIGKRKKGGGSFQRWKDASEAEPAQMVRPVPDDTSTQPKKHRPGWREARAVKTRNSKIKKLSQEIEKLAGEKETQAIRAARALKDAEHAKHIDRKASREMLLEAEKKHKADLQKQQDEFYAAIRDANMQCQMETARALAAEHARLLAQQRHEKKVDKERQKHTAFMARTRDQQSRTDKRWQKKIAKSESNALTKLNKEMALQRTELEEAMTEKEEEANQKLRDKDCELMEDRAKNQERCV